jgi:hypothetical protein
LPILTARAAAGGAPLLAYPLFPGGSLRAVLDSAAAAAALLPAARAAAAAAVAAALAHLAAAGILHGHVTSSSVLLRRPARRAVLTDLYYAGPPAGEPEPGGGAGPGGSGGGCCGAAPPGTAGYECGRWLKTGRYCERAEAYALGVVLLELATGRAPAGLAEALVEDEAEAPEEALDVRCGPWPPAAATVLCRAARACAGRFRDRPGLGEVARGLGEFAAGGDDDEIDCDDGDGGGGGGGGGWEDVGTACVAVAGAEAAAAEGRRAVPGPEEVAEDWEDRYVWRGPPDAHSSTFPELGAGRKAKFKHRTNIGLRGCTARADRLLTAYYSPSHAVSASLGPALGGEMLYIFHFFVGNCKSVCPCLHVCMSVRYR